MNLRTLALTTQLIQLVQTHQQAFQLNPKGTTMTLASRQPIDPSKLIFRRDFHPNISSMVILQDRGSKLLAAFDGEWNNRPVFNIRELYEDMGEWAPGKGVMVPMDQKMEFLGKIAELAIDNGYKPTTRL